MTETDVAIIILKGINILAVSCLLLFIYLSILAAIQKW